MTSTAAIQLLDGTSIPWLAWGNGSGKARNNPVEMGKVALAAGIRHIDTAQGYNNEAETQEAITQGGVPTEEVYITSKLSQEGGATDKDRIPVSEIRNKVAETTAKIGRVPDLFLIHNPFVPPEGELLAAWKEFEALKDEGKLKSIGVSNFRPQDLELILKDCKHKPVVNQIEYHPYLLAHLAPVLAIQAQHGIVTEAFGPLTPAVRHPTGGPLRPFLSQIAQRLHKESGKAVDDTSVLLLWTKAKGVVAVSASGNPENIKQIALAQTLPDLTKEEVAEIDRIGASIHFRHYTEHMETDFPVPSLPSQ